MNKMNLIDIIQTVAIVAAFLLTAWEVYRHTREQKFRNYLDGISGFNDLAKLMIERPELHELYYYSSKDIKKTYEQLSPKEKNNTLL